MEDFHFRKASLLDLPFIYGLIMDGAIDGSFSDRFLTGRGPLDLFLLLFVSVLPFSDSFVRLKRYHLWIFTYEHSELGFMMIEGSAGSNIRTISSLAVKREYRGRKIGTEMVRMFIESVPIDTEIQARCTKYAKSMQHILRSLGFVRHESFTHHLECYSFKKAAELAIFQKTLLT